MLGSVNDLQPCIEASITDAACPRPYFNDNDLLTICLILMIIAKIEELTPTQPPTLTSNLKRLNVNGNVNPTLILILLVTFFLNLYKGLVIK